MTQLSNFLLRVAWSWPNKAKKKCASNKDPNQAALVCTLSSICIRNSIGFYCGTSPSYTDGNAISQAPLSFVSNLCWKIPRFYIIFRVPNQLSWPQPFARRLKAVGRSEQPTGLTGVTTNAIFFCGPFVKKSLIWNDSGSGRMRFFWVPSINSLVLDLWRAFRSNAKPFKYPQPCPVGQLRNLRHIKDTILFATLEAKIPRHCRK